MSYLAETNQVRVPGYVTDIKEIATSKSIYAKVYQVINIDGNNYFRFFEIHIDGNKRQMVDEVAEYDHILVTGKLSIFQVRNTAKTIIEVKSVTPQPFDEDNLKFLQQFKEEARRRKALSREQSQTEDVSLSEQDAATT